MYLYLYYMQDDKDIDIQNYNYPELLQLFNAKRDFKQSVMTSIEEKLKTIKKKLTMEYYLFYYQAYRIIHIIHELFKKDVIQDAENINHIEFYVNSIKKIEDFENLEDSEIFEILDIQPLTKKKNTTKPEQNEATANVNQILNNRIINSYPYPVAPTELNTIKRVTQFKNICLNSCFRSNYYSTSPSDYQYLLPTEIKNVASMRLSSIELPNVWYLYANLNKSNTFRIDITDSDSVTTSHVININDGNYDIDTLPKYLNNNFFYNSITSDLYLQQLQFVIEESSLKSSFVILNSNQYNLKFTFIFSDESDKNIMNTFGWMIGFRLGSYINVDGDLTSEGLFDGVGDQYIFISINDYQYNNNSLNMVCFDNSMMEEDIIGKIPIVNGKLSIVFTESNTLVKTRRYNGPVNIRNLHIKLLNKFGDIINLNHMDFSFTLEMEILYENFGFKHTNTVRGV
jgi:hypothetical protein